MFDLENLSFLITNILFVLSLGFYLIINLQWYNYKIQRVVLNHHKPHWHLIYFFIPFLLYYTTGKFFFIFFYFAYLPALYLWYRKLDKKLVFTWRVKRFFILLLALVIFQDFLCVVTKSCNVFGVFLPIFVTLIGSSIIEKYLFLIYKKEAEKKLNAIKDLTIITVTGSYGKTSTKNFINQILSVKYDTYMTPRSVNTLGGIIKDINTSLDENIKFYITEAGARERGDIYEIATFLKPQCAVVTKAGPAHIEYFKSMDNIIRTKLEVMASSRLQKAFVHCSVTNEPHQKVEFFCDDDIKDLHATLEGLEFSLIINDKKETFHIPNILGKFQASNIYVAIKVALYYNLSVDEIKKALKRLKGVEHRLQKITAGGKIILDDGFNGNLDGMKEAIRLCSLHDKDKVIVTPGLIESTKELNLELINEINKVFDTVIVTSRLNASLFDEHLKVKNKIILKDKSKLQNILATHTKEGDIILFANDAPNFI